MPIQVPRIVIDMLQEAPRQGATQVNFRVIGPDKNMIAHAAIALGLSQADFLRYVAVLGAREIIKERNKILGADAPKDGLAKDLAVIEQKEQLNKQVSEQVEETDQMLETNPGAKNAE